jgi:hypothetical protein
MANETISLGEFFDREEKRMKAEQDAYWTPERLARLDAKMKAEREAQERWDAAHPEKQEEEEEEDNE